MSWNGYVDSLIGQCKGNSCKKATLIGVNGAIWTPAGPANILEISQAEATAISAGFKDPNSFAGTGVVVGGTKYMFLRQEDGKIVTAKKKDIGAVTMQMTKQAIIIGFTPEGQQQGDTNVGVDNIAKYLEGAGY